METDKLNENNKDTKAIDKPIIVAQEEFINTLTKNITESNLPIWLLKPIFSEIKSSIDTAYNQYLNKEIKNYQSQLESDSQK